MKADTVTWRGMVKLRRIPDTWTEEEAAYWWLPREVEPDTRRELVPARYSAEQKETLTVATYRNMLLTAGVGTVLAYLSSLAGSPGTMFQYLALGSGAISGVLPSDTLLAGEYFRKVITSSVVSGNQMTLSTVLLTTDGVGTITNLGLFGLSATGTANSGTLMTKILALPGFSKGSVQYYVDYIVSLASN